MTEQLSRRVGLAVALLIATAVRLPHLRFVPMWDGRQYWDCAQSAFTNASLLQLNCFGHRSMLYMLTVAWPAYLADSSAVALNLTQLAISLLTVVAFHRVASLLFTSPPDGKARVEPAMLTILFASMPVWTAPSINVNADCGVLLGFLLCLALLLDGKRGLATIAGFYLVLSKEMGLLLWLLLAAVEAMLAFRRELLRARTWVTIARTRWFTILPALAYVGVGYALRASGMQSSWVDARKHPSLIKTFLTLDFTNPTFGAYATDIFMLNFAWVMTIVLVAWLWMTLVSIFKHRGVPLTEAIDRERWMFLAVMAVATAYVTTRYPTFNNVRYLLPAFPLLVLGFGVAAATLVRRTEWRMALYVVAIALQLASMSYTIDPVSKFAYGTFAFGDHEMLSMTSRTHECCGEGRDQLVYNLQFTHFDYAQNAVFEAIRPRDGELIATPFYAQWFMQGPLDPRTMHRTLRVTGVIHPRYFTIMDLRTGRVAPPPQAHFIRYPMFPDGPELRALNMGYEIFGPHLIDENGYRLSYLDMRRR